MSQDRMTFAPLVGSDAGLADGWRVAQEAVESAWQRVQAATSDAEKERAKTEWLTASSALTELRRKRPKK